MLLIQETLSSSKFHKRMRQKQSEFLEPIALLPYTCTTHPTQDKSGFAALLDRVVANATPW